MSSFVLKVIALTCMIIDHFGAVTGDANLLRGLGRIAFPIYAFLIAEGCTKTKNMQRYLSRLLLFAFVSEIPFDLLFSNAYFKFDSSKAFLSLSGVSVLDFYYQNVFFTLFLGALAIFFQKNYPKYSVIGLISCCAVGILLKTDYDVIGVLMIYALYTLSQRAILLNPRFNPKHIQCLILVGYGLTIAPTRPLPFWLVMLAPLFVFLYNGQRGPSNKLIQVAFYAAYPLHILLLFLLWQQGTL